MKEELKNTENVKFTENETGIVQNDSVFSFIKRVTGDRIKEDETGFKIPRKSIFEDTRKRNAFGKHYHNNDGTMTAIYGTKPVHYYNEETKKYEDVKTSSSQSTVEPQKNLERDEPVITLKYYEKKEISRSDEISNEWKETALICDIDETHKTELIIDKTEIKRSIENIISVKLRLCSDSHGKCLADGVPIDLRRDAETVIDITKKLESQDECVVQFTSCEDKDSSVKAGGIRLTTLIEIEYLSDDKNPFEKDMYLAGNVNGKLNVVTGELVTEFPDLQVGSPVLPFCISHLHKLNNSTFHCGKDWRLNLDQKLVTSLGYYFYIDAEGYNHALNEVYYYVENGVREVVNKSEVTVSEDGKLTCTINNNAYLVTRELRTNSGLRFATRLEGLSGSEYYEQRQDEEKQLEEYIESYRASLNDLVLVNKNTGEEQTTIINISDDDDNFVTFISYAVDPVVLMTKSESIQYLKLLIDQEQDKIDNIQSTRAAKLEQTKKLYKEYLIKKNELKKLRRQLPIWYLIGDDRTLGFNGAGDLCVIFDKRGNYISVERDEIITKDGAIEAITALSDGEKVTTFTYDDGGKLRSITGANGERILYTYNNDNLIRITYPDDLKINFKYESDAISEVHCTDHSGAVINYDNDSRPETIIYKSTVSGINNDTAEVYGAQINFSIQNAETVEEITISYSWNYTTLTFESSSERYHYDENFDVYAMINTIGETVDTIKFYKKVDYSYIMTMEPKKDVDRITGSTTVDSEITDRFGSLPDLFYLSGGTCSNCFEADWELITLDSFNRPVESKTNWKIIQKENESRKFTRTIVTYGYDTNDPSYPCVKKTANVKCADNEFGNNAVTLYKQIETYSYNTYGEITRVENRVEGEEKTRGISITETEYDEKGYVKKKFTYNSLDSSSKFYTESEIAENGRTIAAIDETGENKTVFDYDATDRIRSQLLPNGSRFAYGYDESGNVTSVTQSTEEGEANTNDKVYSVGCVTKLSSGNNEIYYEYDKKRRPTKITVNGVEETYTYNDDTTLTLPDNTTYSGIKTKLVGKYGATKFYSYFKDGRPLLITQDNYPAQTYYYNSDKSIDRIVDSIANTETEYTYNDLKFLSALTVKKNNSVIFKEEYFYNDFGDLSTKRISFGDSFYYDYVHYYKSNAARDLEYISLPNGLKSYPRKDVFGRNVGKELRTNSGDRLYGEYMTYRKVGDHATNMPSSIYYANGSAIKDNLKYTYDKMGNIAEIKENGLLSVRYAYDSLSRLVREDNVKLNKTFLISYDNCGNILSKRTCPFTLAQTDEITAFTEEKLYTYEGDRLVGFGDQTIEYDQYGRPTNYKGLQTVFNENRLSSIKLGPDNNAPQFNIFYDGAGRRTKIRVYQYDYATLTYDGEGKLFSRTINSEEYRFVYDGGGVCGIDRGGSQYFFRKNAQGDITHIYDINGSLVCKYVYDACGNHKVLNPDGTENTSSTFIGNVNPYRYRGYYYDVVTGLYYLQTRYYDPETGRFISPDDSSYLAPETINGLNLYAYCGNNPVMRVDPTGTWDWWNPFSWDWRTIGDIIINAAAVAVGVVAGAVVCTATTVVGAAVGAAAGLVTGGPAGLLAGATLGAGIGFATGLALGVSAAMATTGLINNTVNAIYYNSVSNGTSSITNHSYSGVNGERAIYINRWDRLDYTKANSGEKWYNLNAMRYYGEYSFHMYTWRVIYDSYEGEKYAGELSLRGIAASAVKANIDPNSIDKNWYVAIISIVFSLLGI